MVFNLALFNIALLKCISLFYDEAIASMQFSIVSVSLDFSLKCFLLQQVKIKMQELTYIFPAAAACRWKQRTENEPQIICIQITLPGETFLCRLHLLKYGHIYEFNYYYFSYERKVCVKYNCKRAGQIFLT